MELSGGRAYRQYEQISWRTMVSIDLGVVSNAHRWLGALWERDKFIGYPSFLWQKLN